MLKKEEILRLINRRQKLRLFFIILGAILCLTSIVFLIIGLANLSDSNLAILNIVNFFTFACFSVVFLVLQYTVAKESIDNYKAMLNEEKPGMETTSNFEIKD